MSGPTAYPRRLALLGSLALLVAACAPAGPGADAPSPSPAEGEPSPTIEPTPGLQPTPDMPSPTADDAGIDQPPPPPADPYDYDYEYGNPPPAQRTAAPVEGLTVSVAHDAVRQDYLTGPTGMALYVFTQDDEGVSNCSGGCAEAWPPLTLAAGENPTRGDGVSGELDVIERDDGTLQVTYNGMPLYYYAADQQPMDTTGEGVGGVWFLARP